MGRRTYSKKRIFLVTLLIILSLTGCGNHRQVQTKEAGTTAKTGTLSFRYFYEEDGIALTSTEHFMYSDWEPVEFDYICTDPTCSHLIESCSARTLSTAESAQKDFSIVYQDHLVIVHARFEWVVNEESETALDVSDIWYMDIYEADLDGRNRTKKAAFSGAIADTAITYAAILVDGKLYFGGPAQERSIQELDAETTETTGFQSWTSDAVYCLDLDDYSLETYAVTQDKEGMGYQYQFYEFDGMVYAIESNFNEDQAVWYRINPLTGECEEIFRFESNVARFCGAIGDTVYYFYDNSGKTLYARDIAEDAEEREIMTESEEDFQVCAFILDGQILFQTDRVYEGENRMTEYAILDKEGNILDTLHYDEYVTFLDVVGDKLIYFTTFSDQEERWADKAELANLMESGVCIGPFVGEKQDALSSGTN